MDAENDDVAEFALLLTSLKARTDRSYAALAHRLGVHASTLHRYCAGESVPLDYAGIERFAALCGASPKERTEVHRRWVLAVAARQRARTSGTRSATGAASTAQTSAHARDGIPADRRPGPHAPADPGPCSALPSRQVSQGAAPSRTGRVRRRPGRSAALAALLAVALGGLIGPAAGPPSAGAERSVSAGALPKPPRADPTGEVPPTGAVPPAEPPSGRGHSSAPAAPAPSARPGKDDSPRGSGAGSNTLRPTAPLTWTANSHLWRLECDHDYVIAKQPQQVPPPPTPADAQAWATSLQAVHGRTTDLRISVQGRGSAAVVLEALHVRVVNRAAPAARPQIAYSMYEGCGATLVPRHFSVDLDARRPLARSVRGNEPGRPTTPTGFPYQVSLREPEVLLVSARTLSCTCDWYLDLEWSSQGRTGTTRIDDHGRPFRTTTVKGLPHYWYRTPRGWIPMTTAREETDGAG
ncbi:helix-turn-helix domain-containing protein [Streptomyces sp. NPDC002952]|uniref:helix-turn-helix domain-containing protein n=1 Tax=Streptomyces sp. NPDC002952 TaxID=3364673 RepID=UPI003699F317